ncbi:MAG: hypothetical protein HC828_08945 [Blastochloris sp.]|nr:hypothetical protein [Blastochloris sp.]
MPTITFSPRYLTSKRDQAPAPGMLLKHYAPTAEVLLFTGTLDPVLARMQATASELVASGKRVGILAPDEEHGSFAGIPVRIASLGARDDLTQIGARLFSGLRELDRQQVDNILVRTYDRVGLGLAIWDRLLRATEGRVIHIDS